MCQYWNEEPCKFEKRCIGLYVPIPNTNSMTNVSTKNTPIGSIYVPRRMKSVMLYQQVWWASDGDGKPIWLTGIAVTILFLPLTRITSDWHESCTRQIVGIERTLPHTVYVESAKILVADLQRFFRDASPLTHRDDKYLDIATLILSIRLFLKRNTSRNTVAFNQSLTSADIVRWEIETYTDGPIRAL